MLVYEIVSHLVKIYCSTAEKKFAETIKGDNSERTLTSRGENWQLTAEILSLFTSGYKL